MRAVNLVPKDFRRGPLSGKGGETFSYMLIAGLVVLLLAVFAVVSTNNSISSKKSEVAKLEQEKLDAQAKADSLQSYASFASLQQARTATVSSLAQSRFDWERILRELSLIVPVNVSLTGLTGTVLPEVAVDGAATLSTRSSIPGPALELVGCAPGQEEVAAFVAALEDIDGVTRVGLETSEKPTAEVTATPSAGPSISEECRTSDASSKFQIVAAFDAAPVPAAAAASSGAPPPAPAAPAPAPAAPNEGGAGQVQQQQAAQQQDVQSATDKSKKATKLVPGH